MDRPCASAAVLDQPPDSVFGAWCGRSGRRWVRRSDRQRARVAGREQRQTGGIRLGRARSPGKLGDSLRIAYGRRWSGELEVEPELEISLPKRDQQYIASAAVGDL